MMKKYTHSLSAGILLVLFLGLNACSKSSGPPPPPSAPLLTFPQESSECTTGVDQSATTSQVTFQWQVADNATAYALRIRNLNTNLNLQVINTTSTTAPVTLEKGVPYSWNVTASNTDTEDTATSPTWAFYNAGSETEYAPFPPALATPASGATVSADTNGQVLLDWTASGDVDGDLWEFEVRFSESNPPTTVVNTQSAGTSEFAVDVLSGGLYYWQIVAIDRQGNRAESPIQGFRVQ